MSSDLIWLTVAINVVLGVITIVNAWALAWYNNKRADERENKLDQPPRLIPSAKQAKLLPRLMFFLSLGGLALSLWKPSPNVDIQILRVSFFVSGATLAIALSLIIKLLRAMSTSVEIAREHWQITRRLVKVVETIVGGEGPDREP